MKSLQTTFAIAFLVFTSGVGAGDSVSHGDYKNHDFTPRQQYFDYARVISAKPIYREVEISRPVRECWEEPVYHTGHGHPKSAGGMLAGGLIGAIVGHQIGKGSGRKAATAVGTLIGAGIGHEAVNGHLHGYEETLVGYEEHCKTRHQVSYEEVIDGYDVVYRYRGQRHRIEMPYDPGKRIKMRIQVTPVI